MQKGLQDNVTEIYCMTSSAEALVSYLNENYCLIILDAQFSDMDSIATTARNTQYLESSDTTGRRSTKGRLGA